MSDPSSPALPADLPPDLSPIEALIMVMARLRTPDSGCPWDLEQDFASIAPYTLEEAYEVADAIARNDRGALREELGDLLFAIVNLARHLKVEPTDAMIAANAKFEPRFAYVEDAMAAAGKTLCAENLAAMDAAWDQAKAEERERA